MDVFCKTIIYNLEINFILRIVIFDRIHTNILYLPIPIDASQQMRMTTYALSVLSLCSEYLIGCVTARKLKCIKWKVGFFHRLFSLFHTLKSFLNNQTCSCIQNRIIERCLYIQHILYVAFYGSFELARRVHSSLTLTYRSMLMATRLNIDEVLQMTSSEM